MKYVRQFVVILLFSCLGELLRALLPFAIPASVYGIVLLFLALFSGVVRLDSVKDTGNYLVEIMPVVFIPGIVGLMASWAAIKVVIVPLFVVMLVSTVAMMTVSGHVTQWLVVWKRRRFVQKLRGGRSHE